MVKEVRVLFLCPDCKKPFQFPVCECGYTVLRKNGICLFCPDATESEYPLGYGHIGHGEDDTDWLENTDLALLKGKILGEYAKNGVLLDFACANGGLTVPALLAGCRVVAVDVYMPALTALMKKAMHHKLPMNRLTACCMREDPPFFEDGCFQCIVSDRSFASFADPKSTVRELYRALKLGGTFVSFYADTVFEQGEKYMEILNFLYGKYWEFLQMQGYAPQTSDWDIPDTQYLARTFGNQKEIVTELNFSRTYTLGDCGLHRLKGKFFPDQAGIPDGVHIEACDQAIYDTVRRYGENFFEVRMTEIVRTLHTFLYTKDEI